MARTMPARMVAEHDSLLARFADRPAFGIPRRLLRSPREASVRIPLDPIACSSGTRSVVPEYTFARSE